jgi:hypothetical protein
MKNPRRNAVGAGAAEARPTRTCCIIYCWTCFEAGSREISGKLRPYRRFACAPRAIRSSVSLQMV